MRLKTYYYLQYPDNKKADPANAWTDMYVEIFLDGDTLATHFAATVYTYRYVQENFISTNNILTENSFLLVPTLNDDWMLEYLEQNLQKIVAIGNLV